MDKIEISYKTIIFTVFFLIALWFLYQIRSIILFLFICIIFASALGPIVDRLEKIKIPRPVAIMFIYLLIIGILTAVLAIIIPVLISQTIALINNLPEFLNKIGFYRLQLQPDIFNEPFTKLPGGLFKIISSTFSNVIMIFAFFVITFYLLMERKHLNRHVRFFFGLESEKKVERLALELENKLGGWVRGQLLLMLIIGLMSWVGMRLLDLDFVLPLAIIAGLLEIIPNIGPTVSMIPALIVGFASSPMMGLAVIAMYFLIQQLENNLIVPKIMQSAVGLHPLVTLLSLMIGFGIGGVGGSLLAIPTVLFIRILVNNFYLPGRFSSQKKV